MSSPGCRATSTQSGTGGKGRGGGCREGHGQAKYTEKLMNDKELTSFRKLTNWSTVK